MKSSLTDTVSNNVHRHTHLGWFRFLLGWLPLLLLLLAILILGALDLRTPHESILLVIASNFVFTVLAAGLVSYLIARSFLVRGAPGLLLLGCGVVLWGTASVGAFVAGNDTNAMVTIHNSCAWLSALCHMVGVYLSLRAKRTLVLPVLWLPIGYFLSMGAVALIVVAGLDGWLPVFFIQGQGGTPIRLFVLISAISMFALTALLLGATGRRPVSAFTYWYALAMGFIAVGLLGVLPQSSAGSALGWAGRLAQFLGGAYMLAAAIASVRESRVWRISLEATLRSNSERLRLATEAAHMATWEWDLATDEIIWNDDHYRILGYEPGQVKANYEGWAARVHPDDLPEVEAVLRRSMERQADYISEYRLLWPDGTTHWAEARGRFEADISGKIARSYGVLIDTTERKRAEEALRDSEERFRVAQEASPDGFSIQRPVRDAQGRVVDFTCLYVNPALERMIGLQKSAMVGHRLLELPGEPGSPFFDLYKHVAESGHARIQESLIESEGSLAGRWFRIAVVAMGKDIAVHSQDITDRKQAEEELKRTKEDLELKVKERTHELETKADQLRALTSELTLAEQRERRRLAKILHDHLQQLLVGSKFRLTVLGRGADKITRQGIKEVDELIDESIRVSRSLTAELSPPILHEAGLNAGLEWLAKRMADTHALFVELNAEQAGNLPESLTILLFEAARELLFNAVKHARVKSARVSLRHIDAMLQLSISDEGLGFEPKSLPQAGESGAGYGLFGIRERLRYLGGNLDISSSPGQGSQFIITLPVAQSSFEDIKPAEAREKVQKEKSAAPSSEKKIRLILADDHSVVRQGLSTVLGSEADIEVVGLAANGQEAVDLARKLFPDVILMDISMPTLNGEEATRIILNEFPDICIIGLSMFEEAERAQAMRDAGASDYLTKSGPIEELVAAIRKGVSTLRKSQSVALQ